MGGSLARPHPSSSLLSFHSLGDVGFLEEVAVETLTALRRFSGCCLGLCSCSESLESSLPSLACLGEVGRREEVAVDSLTDLALLTVLLPVLGVLLFLGSLGEVGLREEVAVDSLGTLVLFVRSLDLYSLVGLLGSAGFCGADSLVSLVFLVRSLDSYSLVGSLGSAGLEGAGDSGECPDIFLAFMSDRERKLRPEEGGAGAGLCGLFIAPSSFLGVNGERDR